MPDDIAVATEPNPVPTIPFLPNGIKWFDLPSYFSLLSTAKRAHFGMNGLFSVHGEQMSDTMFPHYKGDDGLVRRQRDFDVLASPQFHLDRQNKSVTIDSPMRLGELCRFAATVVLPIITRFEEVLPLLHEVYLGREQRNVESIPVPLRRLYHTFEGSDLVRDVWGVCDRLLPGVQKPPVPPYPVRSKATTGFLMNIAGLCDHATASIMTSEHAEQRRVTDWNAAAESAENAASQASRDGDKESPTIIWHGNRCYQIGNVMVSVSESEDWVLQAFVKTPAMGSKLLDEASGMSGARNVLVRLKKNYDGIFAPAIQMPSTKGAGGYRVNIRAAGRPESPN
jgi:hypothetical protein